MRKSILISLALAVLALPGRPEGYLVPRALDEVVAAREARADSPLVALDVQEISALWDDEDPERVLAAVEAAAADRRTLPWVAGYARWVQSRLLLRLGRGGEARRLTEELGFVQSWMVVGPFDNDNRVGFERELPPEAGVGGILDLDASYPGRLRPVGWRRYPEPADLDGATSLGAILEPSETSCAVLATTLEAPRPMRAALRLGADGALRAWLNGIEVYADSGERRAVADRSGAGVQLRRGRNRLVLKSCHDSGSWDLYVRLTDPDGRPLRGVRVDASPAAVAARPPSGSPPFEVPSLWSWFHERAEGGGADAHADLALFLTTLGGDDPAEHRARDEAVAAATADPSVRNLRLLARVHPDRNQRISALERALALEPRSARLLLGLAGERLGGPRPEDALPLVERAADAEPGHPLVAVARADMLDGAGLTLTAASLVRQARARRDTARLTAVLRGLVGRVGLDGEEEALARRYFEGHRAADGVRLDLVRLHARRGELTEAATLLREGLELAPLSRELRRELATVLEASRDPEGAARTYQDAIALRPEDAGLRQDLAYFLDRQGQTDEAVASARRSLELRPENPTLRDWLEAAALEERFEAPYVEAPETFLARRGRAEGHDVLTLVDLRVRQVHPSGQSSEVRQVAFEALTLQGARDVALYRVAHAPERQRLSIERARVYRPDGTTREDVGRRTREVYDPSVRMYYDLRVTDVLFGGVQPGDVVEVRYRLSDNAGANELGDYFGELVPMQWSNPRARSAYVLLAPAGRQLHFNEPDLPGLTHRSRQLGSSVEHVFEATDVPAVPSESRMPPVAEVAGAVHVSTFSSWEELGRWYWTLVRDQLELDRELRRRAEGLVEGLDDDLARVRAVHRDVVRSVRYVALEFGVHRYKPYRVADVARRGFGDCKDQASLMIAMLRHVGVPAEIALVRTSGLGRVSDVPPSLEVFNHAIVYVPSLGLYVDPTAERVAVGDLPEGDQGVLALRVGPSSVVLERTPLLGPDRQGRRLELRVELDREGTARGGVRMDTMGWVAGATRAELDDPAARVRFLEGLLGRHLRGVRVTDVGTSGLEDLVHENRLTAQVEVPGFGRREADSLSFAASMATPLSSLVGEPVRRHELLLGAPFGWEELLEVTLPAGLRPAALPAPVELDGPLAAFRHEVLQEPGGPVVIRSSLGFRVERVSPGQYAELRRIVEAVTAARTARIRLVAR